jgi:two-component system, OmpR family, response regulator
MAKTTSIFIVDDDPVQLQMLTDHLSSMSNFSIKTFPTGEDALKQIAEQPNIVFLDYYLSSVVKDAQDGLDILQEIKKESPLTEVVMLSSQDKIDVAVEVMKYGAFDYIVKGDSAFYRAEKAVYNLYRMAKLKQNASMYKTLTIAFGIAFLIMIIIVGYLKLTGKITDNPGWV